MAMLQWRRCNNDVCAHAKQELAVWNEACLAADQDWHRALQ